MEKKYFEVHYTLQSVLLSKSISPVCLFNSQLYLKHGRTYSNLPLKYKIVDTELQRTKFTVYEQADLSSHLWQKKTSEELEAISIVVYKYAKKRFNERKQFNVLLALSKTAVVPHEDEAQVSSPIVRNDIDQRRTAMRNRLYSCAFLMKPTAISKQQPASMKYREIIKQTSQTLQQREVDLLGIHEEEEEERGGGRGGGGGGQPLAPPLLETPFHQSLPSKSSPEEMFWQNNLSAHVAAAVRDPHKENQNNVDKQAASRSSTVAISAEPQIAWKIIERTHTFEADSNHNSHNNPQNIFSNQQDYSQFRSPISLS